jgi:hypothetical protein
MKSPAMTAEQILRALTRRHFYDGRPPKRALKEASRRRDEMLPLFLNEIEKLLSASSKERAENPTPLLLIFFALGEWGDHGAYRPLARLIRCPEFTDHPGFESVFDEVGHRVIVSVFDGDPEPLFAAVRDPKAHRIARHNILINTLAMLAYNERIGREAIANFLIDSTGNSTITPSSGSAGRRSRHVSIYLHFGRSSSRRSGRSASTDMRSKSSTRI